VTGQIEQWTGPKLRLGQLLSAPNPVTGNVAMRARRNRRVVRLPRRPRAAAGRSTWNMLVWNQHQRLWAATLVGLVVAVLSRRAGLAISRSADGMECCDVRPRVADPTFACDALDARQLRDFYEEKTRLRP